MQLLLYALGFPDLPRLSWLELDEGVALRDEMNQLFPPGLREYLLPCLLVILWWLFRLPDCPDELL